MNTISFGKMTQSAAETAYYQLQGAKMAAKFNQSNENQQKLKDATDAFIRAQYDPDYLFDINPDYIIDDENSKDGQIKLLDENAFLMYKTGKNDDKYAYLGKYKFLTDAYKIADNINFIKQNKEHFVGADKKLACRICNADKSVSFQDAQIQARKILELDA